jgi:protoheme IX farnesyltransferase
MAPAGAWTAATGTPEVVPWILFAIVFLWTPPHCWALALLCKEDDVETELPMMPVVRGDRATLPQILIHTIILSAVSMSLFAFGGGWLYLIAALVLGGLFVRKAVAAFRHRTQRMLRSLFGFSIVYLFGIFTAIVVDSLLA